MKIIILFPIYRLVSEWNFVAQTSRSCSTLIINKSARPIQILETILMEGSVLSIIGSAKGN